MDEDENIKLSLTWSEGEGLSDKTINKIIKKEYFLWSNTFDLREQLRTIAIFCSLFVGNGIVTNQLKKLHETIVKNDASVRRHFNQDKLFRVKLMCSIDNLWNLLLEECTTVSFPETSMQTTSRGMT